MGEGLVDVNPVTATNKSDERPRDRVLSDAEVAAIWRACEDNDYGRILRLLILTGQRRDEIGAMCWSEIDLAKRVWSMPAERTKNKRPHDIYLSDPAVAIIKAIPRREGRDLIFGYGAGGYSGWSGSKETLDKRITEAGGKPLAPWVLHDIRRTVATGMANVGVMPHVVEAVLNHVSGHKAGVAGVYNRASYANEKRQALDVWAAHVGALVGGTSSNVVMLRK
jgi:integrase